MLRVLLVLGLIFAFSNAKSELMCEMVQYNKKDVSRGNLQKVYVAKDKIILYTTKSNLEGYPDKTLANPEGIISYTTSDGNTVISMSNNHRVMILGRLNGETAKFHCGRYNDDNYKKELLPASEIKKLDKIATDELINYIVTLAKKAMPVQIDEVTQIVDVSTNKNTIKYTNTLDIKHELLHEIWKSSSNREKIIEEQYRINIQTTCGVPVVNYLVTKRNVIYIADYLDLDKKLLFTQEIKKEDCL